MLIKETKNSFAKQDVCTVLFISNQSICIEAFISADRPTPVLFLIQFKISLIVI